MLIILVIGEKSWLFLCGGHVMGQYLTPLEKAVECVYNTVTRRIIRYKKYLKPTYRRLLLRCWHHLSSAARPGKQNLLFSRSIAEPGLRRKRCGGADGARRHRGPSAGRTQLGTRRCRYNGGGPAPPGASGLSQARDAGGCYLTNPSELS